MATFPHKAIHTKKLASTTPVLSYSWQRDIARDSSNIEYTVSWDVLNGFSNLRLWKKVPFIGLWEPVTWITTDATDRTNANPSIAVDGNDNLHCVWHATDLTYVGVNRIRYSSSTDGGVTWSERVLLSDSGNYNGVNSTVVVDSVNNLHVVYYGMNSSTGGKYNIFYTKYTGSWSTPEIIALDTTYNHAHTSLCLDGSDNPHVAYFVCNTATWTGNLIKHATKNSGTWTVATAATDTSVARPSIVHTGTYPVIAYLNTAASESQQIRWVSKLGGTWSAPASINSDTAYAQTDPSLGVDSLGHILCAWSATNTNFPTYSEIWFSLFTDSWSIPTRISEGTKTTKNKHQPQIRWSYCHANGLDEVSILFSESNRAATGDAFYDYIWEYTHVAKTSLHYLPLVSEEALETYVGCSRTFTAPTKNVSNPLLGFGSSGAPDESRAYCPAVVQVAEGDWRMWYSGLDSSGYLSVCYATAPSFDGPWTSQGRIIAPGALRTTPEDVGTWDYLYIYANTVIYDPSAAEGYQFKMVCSGAATSNSTQTGALYKGGYARSSDGITWYLYAGPGVWVEGLAGGANTVSVFGPSGTSDDFFFYNAQPWSLYDLGDNAPDIEHRYLTAFQAWEDNVPSKGRKGGVAYSSDLINWVKYPIPILEGTSTGWPASVLQEQFHGINVFNYRGVWTVISEANSGGVPTEVYLVQSERLSVGLAEQGTDKSVPVGSEGAWDDTHIYNYATIPIRSDGSTHLYYSGNSDDTTNPIQIGLTSIVTDREVGYTFSTDGNIKLKPIINPAGLVLRLNLDGISSEKLEVALESTEGIELVGYGKNDCDDIEVGGVSVLVTWGGNHALPTEDCVPVIYRTAL